jgi:hypothetical protein
MCDVLKELLNVNVLLCGSASLFALSLKNEKLIQMKTELTTRLCTLFAECNVDLF